MTSTEWNAAIDAALAKVREQRAVFSSDAYATPQPIGGFMERFACNSIEVEIEALRKPDTPPTPATDEREAVARALCELHIRNVRRHDTDATTLEAVLPGAIEMHWFDFQLEADAALSALAPIRAQEIAAALAALTGAA